MSRLQCEITQPVTPVGLDWVFIEGLVEQVLIGIDVCELDQPQAVRFDLSIGQRTSRASHTDDVADTVHYGLVLNRIQQLARENRFNMLERLAEAVAQRIIDEFPVEVVKVRLAKPFKFRNVEAVGVEIERRASRPAVCIRLPEPVRAQARSGGQAA